MDIAPEVEEFVSIETKKEKLYKIILYNDDVNTFEHVIKLLVDVCEHTYEQAEQCAYIVHYSGRCNVKEGSYKSLKPKCLKLLAAKLSAKII